jgi:chemotaxis protein MotA
MSLLLGFAVVFGSIIAGYSMHGGKVAALMQVSEFIIIGGAALGSVIVGFGPKGAMSLLQGSMALMKGNPYKKSVFLELLQCMYDLFILAKKEGMLALERHIEEPSASEIFAKYPSFINSHHAVDLLCDTMKLVIMGGITVYDLSDLMDLDLEAQKEEALKTSGIFSTISDSMPGFGIVAAVLGVVITMQAIGGSPAQIGEKVAGALVGTFLGVLMAYGVFAPLSKASESIAVTECQYMACIKHAVVAFARGDAPLTCVEYSRRNIEPELRPGFSELENACKGRSLSVDSPIEMSEAA